MFVTTNLTTYLTISPPQHPNISTPPHHLTITPSQHVLPQPPPSRLPPHLPLLKRAARPSQQSAPRRTARRARQALACRSRASDAPAEQQSSAAVGRAGGHNVPAARRHAAFNTVSIRQTAPKTHRNGVCLNSNTSCGTPCLHIPTDSVHSIHPQSASIHP